MFFKVQILLRGKIVESANGLADERMPHAWHLHNATDTRGLSKSALHFVANLCQQLGQSECTATAPASFLISYNVVYGVHRRTSSYQVANQEPNGMQKKTTIKRQLVGCWPPNGRRSRTTTDIARLVERWIRNSVNFRTPSAPPLGSMLLCATRAWPFQVYKQSDCFNESLYANETSKMTRIDDLVLVSARYPSIRHSLVHGELSVVNWMHI